MRSFRQADSRKTDGGDQAGSEPVGISLKLDRIPVSGHGMSCLGAGSGCRSENWTHPSPGQAQGRGPSQTSTQGSIVAAQPSPGSSSSGSLENASRLAAPGAACPWPRHWPHTQASLAQRYPDASCSEPLDLAPISQPVSLRLRGWAMARTVPLHQNPALLANFSALSAHRKQ